MPSETGIRIVAGLGNPGPEYRRTRHNAGFEVLDRLAEKLGVAFAFKSALSAELAEARTDAGKLWLIKPQTFMNRSGDAVAELRRKTGAEPEQILVVYDEVDLPTGALRLRERGSAGGHNGVASVIERLGSPGFPRLRVGVGPRPPGENLVNYVLSKWPPDAYSPVSRALDAAAEAVLSAVREGLPKAMNRFNATRGTE
jgi:PTH1 family peptidyl-tRNA hydrolase